MIKSKSPPISSREKLIEAKDQKGRRVSPVGLPPNELLDRAHRGRYRQQEQQAAAGTRPVTQTSAGQPNSRSNASLTDVDGRAAATSAERRTPFRKIDP